MNYLLLILINVAFLIANCSPVFADSLTENEIVDSGEFSSKTFWITIELLSVEWKQGCLTQANCGKPRLQMSKSMSISEEKKSVSWPITLQMFQEGPKTFVSSWVAGDPEDVTLGCQVIGQDPQYGFQRICDQSHSLKLFTQKIAKDFINNPRDSRPKEDEESKGKMLVEVKGQCFNATLTVRKHLSRCPWCPKPKEATYAVIGQPDLDPQAQSLSFLQDQMFNISIISILGIIALFTIIAFICLLVTHMKQRKIHLKFKKNLSESSANNTLPRTMVKLTRPITASHYHQPYMYMPSNATLNKKTIIKPKYDMCDHTYSVAADLLRSDAEESGYETPWDKKSSLNAPPMPYWQNHPSCNRSPDVISPPCMSDRSSSGPSFMGNHAKQTYNNNATSTTSANSSMSSTGHHHNDSGLESF